MATPLRQYRILPETVYQKLMTQKRQATMTTVSQPHPDGGWHESARQKIEHDEEDPAPFNLQELMQLIRKSTK